MLARCCRRIVWARLDRDDEAARKGKHLAERFYCAVAADVVNALKDEWRAA